MSEIKAAFDGLITDLTRTVDQLERAVSGDITVQVGGAVLDQRLTDAINKRSPLKGNVIAALAGAGFAYATVIIELLPLVALDAMATGESPDQYVEQFKSLSERLKDATAALKAKSPTVRNLTDTIDQSPIFYADSNGGTLEVGPAPGDNDEAFDEDRVLAVLASLGLNKVQGLEQVAPGHYVGTAVLNKGDAEALFDGSEGSPFNTEAPRQPDETWGGPFSHYPRRA